MLEIPTQIFEGRVRLEILEEGDQFICPDHMPANPELDETLLVFEGMNTRSKFSFIAIFVVVIILGCSSRE
jgi:hypothetical protein